MNLFGGGQAQQQEVGKPPSIDEARQRIENLKRGQRMQGRASAMLAAGKESPTAQRDVTGN